MPRDDGDADAHADGDDHGGALPLTPVHSEERRRGEGSVGADGAAEPLLADADSSTPLAASPNYSDP